MKAAAAIISEVREGDLILVKGSRSVETDKVVQCAEGDSPACGCGQKMTGQWSVVSS